MSHLCPSCGYPIGWLGRALAWFVGDMHGCALRAVLPPSISAAPDVRVDVCWGGFDEHGQWVPNPHLMMNAAEQRRQNIANGHITADGWRVR